MNLSAGPVITDAGASQVCSTRTIWVLRGLCLAGLTISAYLAWTAFNMVQVFGCDGGAIIDCAHVLKSRWSKVLGVPVSLPACGLYASLLGMLSFAGRKAPAAFTQALWNGLTLAATTAGLSALWFVGLQVSDGKLCPYCIAVHTCSLLIAGIILKNHASTAAMKGWLASASAGAVALLITIQVSTPEPETFQVVEYPVEDIDTTSAEGSLQDGPEDFAPPGEVFESPGFESPGEVFEAPGQDADAGQVSVPSVQESPEAVKADSGQPVAATLLLILPPRLMMLSNMLVATLQESTAGNSAAESNVATSDEPASESETKTSDTAAKPTAETPSSDANPKEATSTSEAEKAESEEAKAVKVQEPAKPERKVVTVAGNRVSLDVKQWPLLGNPDARYVFVEMYDYTCPHCRNTHHAIKGAFLKYGDDLAILALPVPLDPSCNDAASGGGHAGACELARIAVAVWRVNPKKFREFHDWMFESQRSSASAKLEAERLVGAEKFQKEYSSKIPSDYVKRHVDLYKKVGRGSVPKLMFPNSTINGEVNSSVTLCSTIERELSSVVVK